MTVVGLVRNLVKIYEREIGPKVDCQQGREKRFYSLGILKIGGDGFSFVEWWSSYLVALERISFGGYIKGLMWCSKSDVLTCQSGGNIE